MIAVGKVRVEPRTLTVKDVNDVHLNRDRGNRRDFRQWSAYGGGVLIYLESGETLRQPYVPYLSDPYDNNSYKTKKKIFCLMVASLLQSLAKLWLLGMVETETKNFNVKGQNQLSQGS
ncbi:hypothetical protein LguiB_035795 [Lonicera macranthoides]